MSVAFIASSTPVGVSSGTATTGAIDTTGASLLLIYVATALANAASATISDSKSNTWHALTNSNASNTREGCWFYAKNPTVGTGHTFSGTNGGFCSIQAMAFSVVDTSSPFDVENTNQNTSNSAASATTGSVTPNQNNSLIVAGISGFWTSGNWTPNSGFTLDHSFNSASFENLSTAYLVQGTAGAVNVTFSATGASSNGIAANIAVFKPSGAGGAQTVTPGSAIATGESWPTPKVNLKIAPAAAIATGESWPTPKVNLKIAPATIATGESWPTPKIAGPVDVATIPTAEHWGTHVVTGPITVATIASAEHWPTVKVAGPVIVATIPGAQSWPTPVVTGAIIVLTIATGEHWPTPFLNVAQTISPAAAIATAEHWGSYFVDLVQSILPATIATGESWPTPQVHGSPKFIPVVTIRSAEFWPRSEILGGTLFPIQLLIGGVDRTKYLRVQTAQFSSQTIGRWTAYLDLFDDTLTYAPALGQTVRIIDFGRVAFTGCIQDRIIDRLLSSAQAITYHLTCVDKSGILDHRVVKNRTYLAGSDVATAILDIVASFLDGEGFTTEGVPLDGSLGTFDSDLKFNFNTCTQAFDDIADASGTVWLCPDGVITFSPFDDLDAAPFALTETSKNWRNLTARDSTIDYRNVQYAVSNLNVMPGSGTGSGGGNNLTEDFDWFNDEPGIVSGFNSSGVRVPQFIKTSLPIGSIVSIKVAGHLQTVVDFGAFSGETSSGPNDYLWFYAGPATQQFGQPGDTAGPTLGPIADHAAIEVVYIPATTNAGGQFGEALDPIPPDGFQNDGSFGTCGSGIYEAVLQVQNVSTQADLIAIAAAELARRGGIPKILQCEVDRPGLQPGQLLSVDIPLVELAEETMLITAVSAVSVAVDLGLQAANAWHTTFRYQITATTNRDLPNWIKWFERLLRRTQNALPVYQYEEASFAIALDGSNVNGLISTNPYIVKRTGLLFDMHVAAQEAPIDEDLVIQFKVGSLLVPGSVTLPAGSTANTDFVFTFPTTVQYYVFARPPNGPNDVVTVIGTYRVVGSNPTPAVGVTAWMRWRI